MSIRERSLSRFNMLPNLKRIVRREYCRTITDLLDRAVRIELALEKEAGDRTSIPLKSSVYPETAYQPNGGSNRRSKPKTRPMPTDAGVQFDKSKGERARGNSCARCVIR